MSVQTKGKLLKKVQKSLPKDPAQRHEALATLLNGSFNKETTLPLNSVNNPALTEVEISRPSPNVSEDEISRQSPNVRDFVSVIENGKKIKIQVRHLLLTMKEAYQLFKHDHLDIKIGLSRFCELRPVNVRSIANLPHNVCVCTYHKNMRFALGSLVKVDRLLLSNIKIGKDMSQNFVCKDSLNDCFYNKCKDLKFFQQFLATIEPLNFETTWYQWQKPNEKRYAVIEKVKKFGSGKELIAHIMSMREKFTTHANIKGNQSKCFKLSITKSMNPSLNVATIQVDYAENFKCFSQNEPQAAHYGQNQISLLTAAIWQKNIKTFTIASDSLDHTKTSLIANSDKLLEFISFNTQEIHIFSNNATSLFKNKVVMSAIMHFEKKFNRIIFWHFFAAMHGKGVVDGVGATVKRLATNRVKSGKIGTQSANDFVNAIQDINVKVLYLSEEEKSARNYALKLSQIIQQAKKVKDISKSHYFYVGKSQIIAEKTSP